MGVTARDAREAAQQAAQAIRGGNERMTRDEVDRKKDIAAMDMLEKSGVGPMYAIALLTPLYLDMVKNLALAGSENEAIVRVALQFAFSNVEQLCLFIVEESRKRPVNRFFRVRR